MLERLESAGRARQRQNGHAASGERLRIHPRSCANRATRRHAALRGLLDAVAPGGTLLFATHALADLIPRPDDDFDPTAYYQPDDIARLLDPTWSVQLIETRPRAAQAPTGTPHTHDSVLRALRPPGRTIPRRAAPSAG
ncbi:hypothetical protein [Streptomyces sp. NPDC127108]|uniref:hypothetical protein n=1 Tax=Streptomyces sp. NPDC127108 TaxID=3345361 RepID=UPI003627AE3D